jgi:formylglycine-generating enzyme required for sulfatase activity
MRTTIAIALLLGLLGAAPAWAQLLETQPEVARQAFSRDFGGGHVDCLLTLRAGGAFAPGQRALLQVDLDSTVGGDGLRAQIINGFIVFALPPGLEPDGQPRLLYFNEQTGGYDYMYSKAYPLLDRLAGADGAFADAASNDPVRIRQGLEQISLALDSTVSPQGPASPRLTGSDRVYSLAGVSWLIPANVYMKELVGLFTPEPGLYPAAKLRAVLQVKTTGALTGDPIEVYAGGLSAAMSQMELLPNQLPPTAIPLALVPAASAPAPAEAETTPAASEPVLETVPAEPAPATNEPAPAAEPPAVDPPAGQADPFQREQSRQTSTPPLASAGQDEQPATKDEPAPVSAPPPQPIPALVYSYEWISWETQYIPASTPATTSLPVSAPGQLKPPVGQFDFPEETLVQLEPTAPPAAAPPESTPPAATPPVEATPAELAPTQPPAASVPTTPPAEEKPAAPPAETKPNDQSADKPQRPVRQDAASKPAPTEPAADKPAQSQPAASVPKEAAGSTSSARQVAPGTLPTAPQEYTVPLKPIGGGGAPANSNDAPPASTGDAGQDGFRLKPADDSAAGGPPNVITPQLPDSQMNLPAPAGLDDMILIPAGPFLMGTASGQGGDADEQPQAEVDVPAYYIDKYPVTNRQFHNFVISAGYKPEGNWQKYYAQGTADLPVRGVSHNDALAFAKWAGKRLPTEAEWEKAARGADGRTYPWGEDWSAEIMPRGDETTLYAVMTAPRTASPYGVMGMSGLVWQWTASAYTQAYPFNPAVQGDKFVLRGGAYSNGRGVIRCANRYFEPGNVALNTFGFRCVKDAP